MIETVKIHMINLSRPAVLMDEGKRRTRDLVRLGRSQPFDDALSQRGFARAEVADKQHHHLPWKRVREFLAKGNGFLFRRGLVGGHTAPWLVANSAAGQLRSGIFRPIRRRQSRRKGHAGRPPLLWLAPRPAGTAPKNRRSFR